MSKLLLALLLAVSPVLAASLAVQTGEWPDGTKFAWQCQTNARGVVKFVVVLPGDKVYEGQLSCNTSI